SGGGQEEGGGEEEAQGGQAARPHAPPGQPPPVASRAVRALITGITGQDGSLLAELLVAEGCEVVGVSRGATDARAVANLAAVADAVTLVRGDLDDPASLVRAVREVDPDEIYHLAAPTFVPASWEQPAATLGAIAGATAALLAAAGDARIVVAASSEVFG